jgi:putative transposase
VRSQFHISERRACRVLRQNRSTQRKAPWGRADEDRLVADMIELTRQLGRYGYRRIVALLRDAGWRVNDKRVERLRKADNRQGVTGSAGINDVVANLIHRFLFRAQGKSLRV